MKIEALYDGITHTLTYVVYDETTLDAVVIDPVLDFDLETKKLSHESVKKLVDFTQSKNLRVHYILETHAHADHLSSAKLLKEKYFTDAKVGVGSHITKVQATFKPVFGLGDDFHADGSQFDLLLTEGQVLNAGKLSLKVVETPGHTPACVSYLCKDALFVGDAIFMPDTGTGRCDFPLGSAHDLYDSIKNKIYALPDETRLFVGHDYQPGGRAIKYQTTVKESKASNKSLTAQATEKDFTDFRKNRDSGLDAPRLLYPSVQVNIDAGNVKQDSSGAAILKDPVKT